MSRNKYRITIFCIAGIALACNLPDQTCKDIDGNAYRIVQIGTQVWMAENLRVTRAPDGSPLQTHFPNDDSSTIKTYGLLYDWKTALRAAPEGWHVPSDDEWKILESYLGDRAVLALKDTAYWQSDNTSSTIAAAFSARSAGYWNDGEFDNRFGKTAVFWSSTPADSHFVWARTLSTNHDTLRRAQQHPHYGFSVRCIMNDK